MVIDPLAAEIERQQAESFADDGGIRQTGLARHAAAVLRHDAEFGRQRFQRLTLARAPATVPCSPPILDKAF